MTIEKIKIKKAMITEHTLFLYVATTSTTFSDGLTRTTRTLQIIDFHTTCFKLIDPLLYHLYIHTLFTTHRDQFALNITANFTFLTKNLITARISQSW